MTATNPSMRDTSNAGLPAHVDSRGTVKDIARRAWQTIVTYPLYAKSAARLTLCALGGLVILSCSYFLADYTSLAQINASKIANVRHALALQNAGGSAEALRSGQLLVAALLEDETLRQGPGNSIASIRAAASLPEINAVAAQLQDAERAILNDAETVQRVVKWIQLASFAAMLWLLGGLAWDLRRILVDSTCRIPIYAPPPGAPNGNASTAADEITRFESAMSRLQTDVEGKSAHAAELTALVTRMMRAHDFLSKAITSTIESPFRTSMLRKLLFALERALDLENAAIFFSEDSARELSESCLFSHHEPGVAQQQLNLAVLKGGAGVLIHMPSDEAGPRAAGVAFADRAGELSFILVEYKPDRVLKSFEAQTLRVTASLLSIVAKLDGHDQEARRVALLEERAAIARELHDSLAQSLSYMKIQLARLQSYQGNTEIDSRKQIHDVTSELRQGLDNAYKELRGLLSTFRVHMDARGLDCAIESAIEEFTQRSGVPVALDSRLMGVPLTVNEEFHVLQVVREALSNILHHASANSVTIVMAQQGNKAVVISIEDDGIGYHPPPDGPTAHHGLTIMQERAFSLGGTTDITPRADGGTRVKLTFTPKKSQ